MSLKDAFLRTRQAALDIAVERARPKTWKAGRVTQDGVTTVTTDPVAADTPDGTHAELLAAHGFDPARYRIVGPIRSTRWTAYLPKEYRTNSVEGGLPGAQECVFQAHLFAPLTLRLRHCTTWWPSVGCPSVVRIRAMDAAV